MAYLDAAGVTKLTRLYDERYGGGGGGRNKMYVLYGGLLSPTSDDTAYDDLEDDISNYDRITIVYSANDRFYTHVVVNRGMPSFSTNIVKSHVIPQSGHIYTSQLEITFWQTMVFVGQGSSYVIDTSSLTITSAEIPNLDFEILEIYGEKLDIVELE